MSELVAAVGQRIADGCIGASQVPAALGLVKYTSPMALWLELRGEGRELVAPFVQEAAEFGQLFEPVLRGRYALQERKLVRVPTASLTRDGWLRATPDGYVCDPQTDHDIGTEEWAHDRTPDDMIGLVQIKCRSAWKADEWADGPPAAEEVQCRVEMAVAGAPWNDLVCLLGGNRAIKYRITRDLEIEAKIVRDARAFWQLVLDGTPPSVDDSEAWASHASSLMRPSKVVLHADDEIRALITELRQARTQRKHAEAMEAAQKTQLLLRLGAAGATVIEAGDLGKISAFPNPARMDWKLYAESLEAYLRGIGDRGREGDSRDRFKKPGQGWQLRTPKAWGEDE